MKISINQIKSMESLVHVGNKLFTKEQVKEIGNV